MQSAMERSSMCSGIFVLLLFFLIAAPLLFAGELISDPHFKRGLDVLHPQSGQSQGSIGWSDESPVWECGQWHSQSSLIDIAPTTPADGLYEWANADKVVRRDPAPTTMIFISASIPTASTAASIGKTGSRGRIFWCSSVSVRRGRPVRVVRRCPRWRR